MLLKLLLKWHQEIFASKGLLLLIRHGKMIQELYHVINRISSSIAFPVAVLLPNIPEIETQFFNHDFIHKVSCVSEEKLLSNLELNWSLIMLGMHVTLAVSMVLRHVLSFDQRSNV